MVVYLEYSNSKLWFGMLFIYYRLFLRRFAVSTVTVFILLVCWVLYIGLLMFKFLLSLQLSLILFNNVCKH